MAFSDAVKLSAKRKAHFKCCICQRPSVSLEAHHIIPEADGGPDTEDNAAPLCPTCHAEYGANPEKRTAIRVQRDFWYEVCERRYAPDSELMERLAGLLEGATSTFTGFQEYLNRVVKPEAPEASPRSHAVSGASLGKGSGHGTAIVTKRVDVAGMVLPGEARAEGSTVHATTYDSGTIHVEESSTVEILKPGDQGDEGDFQQEPRTEIEILEALDKLFDQVWYNRHLYHRTEIEEGKAEVSRKVWGMLLASAARVEAKYKDDPEALGPWSDFEWGMINGKLSALRWILGDEWDFLDT